ncbi:MAG: hypothetical protein AAGI12_09275 [Pseudomonadota bacterium]
MSVDGLLEFAKMEAQIVRNYEVLLVTLLGGQLTATYLVFGLENPVASIFLALLFALGLTGSFSLSIGRSFHYGLYERARKEWATKNFFNTDKLDEIYQQRKTDAMIFSFGSTTLPYWILWPTLTGLVPFCAMIIRMSQ